MDPTVTGALIGLGGAVVGAIASASVPVMTLRARRRDDANAGRRNDTLGLYDVLVRLLKARGINDWRTAMHTHSEAVVAAERLLLNADQRDVKQLEKVVLFNLKGAVESQNLALSSASVEAMTQVLRRWCNGEIHGDKILDAYDIALDTQLDARESNRS